MSARGKSGRRILSLILAGILILAGTAVILYPYAQQWLYGRQASDGYRRFVQQVAAGGLTESDLAFPDAEGAQIQEEIPYSENVPYPELYLQMRAYNDAIYENKQVDLTDPWSYEKASFSLSEYGFEEEIIGYVKIPKIGAEIPIYLGASTENMELGAAHLSQTSLPIGGENTNCVICAHRNYHKAELFTRLPELEEGDEVIVTNPWYTMTYRVTETTTILANEVDKLKIQDEKDMLSLFTCFYNGNRKDRFVAYCERVEDAEGAGSAEMEPGVETETNGTGNAV